VREFPEDCHPEAIARARGADSGLLAGCDGLAVDRWMNPAVPCTY